MSERIERELVLEASPSEVWHAVTDGEWLAEWLAVPVERVLISNGSLQLIEFLCLHLLQPDDVAHAVAALVTQAPGSFISEVHIRPTQKP